ncbi:CDC50/LEM3 family [Dunaliella salina]|uniref:ALA-interacting subunit n=1 Tax=Dunaliella salina TaxID=3046 RepID=A0ABQ7FYS3_DUNSA|nr:CDC50/LEM3 family [Dunaliella salina]|eukprot:KAF5827486.1 CDC50/LEM3 family [Dunaliella salina]
MAKAVVVIFFLMAAVLLPLGAVLLVYGLKPVQVSARYDDSCIPNAPNNLARQRYLWENVNNTQALQCTTTLEIPEDMDGPIYVYYELEGFYQNHRRYVRSRSNVQLAKAEGDPEIYLCEPLDYYAGDPSRLIDPCGLIAWTYFNDSYTMEVTRTDTGNTEELDISDKGIAFEADVEEIFADYEPQNFNPDLSQWRGGGQIQGTPQSDERFINWMRIAALPNFRKLWGRISTDLKKGDRVEVTIMNRYNTYSFDGVKSIVLANTSWLGGHNIFLGTAYLVTGGVSFLMGLLYYFVRLLRPRKFGDISQLKEVDT